MMRQVPVTLAVASFIGAGILPACSDTSSGAANNAPPAASAGASAVVGSAQANGSTSSGAAGAPTAGTSSGGMATGGGAGTAGAPVGGTAGAGGADASSAGMGGGAGNGGAMQVGPVVDPPGENCTGEAIHLGEMQIFPNEWNDPRAETCVFLKPDGTFGWRWTNGDFGAPVGPDMPTLMVNKDWPNYPELEFGINPWNAQGLDRSTTTLLPRKLGELTEASMTVNVHTDVSGGKWNLAFEMWLADNNPVDHPGSKAIAEIMVFFGNDPAYWPTDPQTADKINDGEHDYLLYQSSDTWGANNDQKYRQYRLSGGSSTFNGKLNIGKFLEHYKQEGFASDLWLTRFELGNEVYSGAKGTTTISSIGFTVNGESRQAKTMP